MFNAPCKSVRYFPFINKKQELNFDYFPRHEFFLYAIYSRYVFVLKTYRHWGSRTHLLKINKEKITNLQHFKCIFRLKIFITILKLVHKLKYLLLLIKILHKFQIIQAYICIKCVKF